MTPSTEAGRDFLAEHPGSDPEDTREHILAIEAAARAEGITLSIEMMRMSYRLWRGYPISGQHNDGYLALLDTIAEDRSHA